MHYGFFLSSAVSASALLAVAFRALPVVYQKLYQLIGSGYGWMRNFTEATIGNGANASFEQDYRTANPRSKKSGQLVRTSFSDQ